MSFKICFKFIIFSYSILGSLSPLYALEIVQILNPIESINPQDIEPPITPIPEDITPQENPPPPLNLNPETRENQSVEGNIKVINFILTGNTVFSNQELEEYVLKLSFINQPLSSIENQDFSFLQLQEITQKITEYYQNQGYQTTGATINLGNINTIPDSTDVTINIIEGTLQAINVKQKDTENEGQLNNYIQQHLGINLNQPLNINELLEHLQLLQLDPLINSLSATLTDSVEQGQQILNIEYIPNNTFKTSFNLNNSRSPSIGTFQRSLILQESNLLTSGDTFTFGYNNTNGSNSFNFDYSIPINSQYGKIFFTYNRGNNDIIETPFNILDITSESDSYNLIFKQPIIRSFNQNTNTYQEFSLSLNASLRDSRSFLLNYPFPLSPGADENGHLRTFALRFGQNWTNQNPQEIFALSSEFSIGLNALNSTINQQIIGVEEIPDSEFFSWRGQAQYVRLMAPQTLLLVRGNIQLADRALVSSEQFTLGGFGSVRGYRQDSLLTDNGVFFSTELQYPILKVFNDSIIQLIPFFDYGTTWNSGNKSNPEISSLASMGLGLQWKQDDNFTMRLDWGIPLINLNSSKNTLQEQGIYLNIQYNL
jgi:hemolysin activation/secretion protein